MENGTIIARIFSVVGYTPPNRLRTFQHSKQVSEPKHRE